MIDLLVADDARGFGLGAALAIEGVPSRRIDRASEFDAQVLVVTGRPARRRRARAGAPGPDGRDRCRRRRAASRPSTRRAVQPRRSTSRSGPTPCAASRGPTRRRAPPAAGDRISRASRSRRARCSRRSRTPHGRRTPAIVQRGHQVWCLFDLGTALDRPAHRDVRSRSRRPGRCRSGVTRSAARALLPRTGRRPRAWCSAGATHDSTAISAALGARASTYPVDTTGWLLVELLKALVRRAGGELVRLARWPAPFDSAATLTHDIEPSHLRVHRRPRAAPVAAWRAADIRRPSVWSRAPPAGRCSCARRRSSGAPEVLCHGLEHRGETSGGLADRHRRRHRVAHARSSSGGSTAPSTASAARASIARPTSCGRSIALGFEYDSSYPDVDRENLDHFGGGVRLNVPFRPPIVDPGRSPAPEPLPRAAA